MPGGARSTRVFRRRGYYVRRPLGSNGSQTKAKEMVFIDSKSVCGEHTLAFSPS